MSTTPSATDLQNIRDEMGVVVSKLADADITRFWARVDYSNALIQFEACCALLARAAKASLANYHDYSTGNTSEKLSQVVQQLDRIYQEFKPSLEKAQGKRQIAVGWARQAQAIDTLPIENSPNSPYGVRFAWQELFPNNP